MGKLIIFSAPSGSGKSTIINYLMQQGLLVRTPKGRMATARAWEHIGLTPPEAPDRA